MNIGAASIFIVILVLGLFVNKYVLSVLGFKYPTIFQVNTFLPHNILKNILFFSTTRKFFPSINISSSSSGLADSLWTTIIQNSHSRLQIKFQGQEFETLSRWAWWSFPDQMVTPNYFSGDPNRPPSLDLTPAWLPLLHHLPHRQLQGLGGGTQHNYTFTQYTCWLSWIKLSSSS